jgi:GMP synthase (glutamine-hydrolysing)
MPGVPKTASVLAVSEGCPRQIIRYSKKVYGFQCHIDVTLEDVQKAICICEKDFISAKYIQSKNDFLMNDFLSINQIMISVLEKFIQLE